MTANPHHTKRWTILVILALAQLMVVLDATIVNIALPSAQKALHFANSDRQWIVTAYALAFGSLLLLGGRISDLFGRKWTFIGGLAGFAIASAVGGAAQSFGMLAVSRTFQGAFGALLAPAAMSLLTTTFLDPAERNKAFGIWGAIAGSGASIGLILGGILTQTLSWRYSMYVNLVFAIIAIAGALVLLHNEVPAVKPKLDIPGVLTVSAGLFSLVFGFSHAETTSWTNPTTLGFLISGAVLLALFAAIQSRSRNPLLPLRVVTNRNRAASFITIGISGSAVFGVFLFLTYYLQQNRGYSPVATGIAFLPMTAAVMISAAVATNKLRARFGPRPLVVTGMALGAAGMLYLSRLGVDSSYVSAILPALIAIGVGLGLSMASAMNSATLGVDPADAGVASATVSASQQIGGSLGTALLSTIATSALTTYIAGAHTHVSQALIANAAVHADTTAFTWAAAIFAIGAVLAGSLFERGTKALEVDPGMAPALAH
ncbi:MAG TPA: MFS transporter [Solirubrobacteraceae bacterium]|nr:MFS transporter [Solirubrobacteraceae bacterium]